MPSHVILLKVFVGSPGDVRAARDELRQIVHRLNDSAAIPQGICIQVVGWENVPAGAGDPQDVINEYLGDCDLLVVILGRRLGTPARGAPSGTVEEFQLAYNSFKQGCLDDIKVYFCGNMLVDAGDREATEQARNVIAWRDQIWRERLVFSHTYQDDDDLSTRLQRDLQAWLTTWSQIVQSALPTLGISQATSDRANTLLYDPIFEKAAARMRLWKKRDPEATSKVGRLQELAFHCFLGITRPRLFELRAWSRIEAEASHLPVPPLFSFADVPEPVWAACLDGGTARRLRLGGPAERAWLAATYPPEILFVTEHGFTFSRPELLWYFVAGKLFESIRISDSDPMAQREFVNEVHQFLSTMVRRAPECGEVLRRWLSDPAEPAIVRNFAAFELGMSQEVRAIDDLIACIEHDGGDHVRAYAADALGMIKDRRAVPKLLRLARTLDDDAARPRLHQAILYIKNVIPNPYW